MQHLLLCLLRDKPQFFPSLGHLSFSPTPEILQYDWLVFSQSVQIGNEKVLKA